MAIQLQSFNQILGAMIRKIISETPLNDVNTGSVLLSLLEAAASNDFENNVAILNILELLNIDAVRNGDLDTRAADYGLSRKTAIKASGYVTIYNTNITKQSTSLYNIKPAPVSGQTTLYVNDTTGWAASGSLYVGRGTNSFEGPIPYTSITVYPTFSEITLGSALQKDHLLSDTVVNSQGEPDRVIAASEIVKIPSNNQNPEIRYVTLREAVIPAGEDKVENVPVIASVAGSSGNAKINTITEFDTLPFVGATVSNTSSFTDGADTETDTELRNRIKTFTTTLARGTAPSIVAAVLGISDPDENKQVASAAIIESTSIGQPSLLYIDDGSGFEPSYAGQSVDVLLANANGTEEFLQLANFPVPRPQVVNLGQGPFTLTDSMFLTVAIDGANETIYLETTDFVNISAATVTELVVAINAKATTFKARLTNSSNNILIYPVAYDAEIIQVLPLGANDSESLYANAKLLFPTNESSYISLYQNSTRLYEKNKTAAVETIVYGSWNIIATGTLSMAVDNTPTQSATFNLSDFPGASSFEALTLSDWADAFNSKFAGITAVVTSSETLKISSNKSGDTSSILINGGTYLSQMFGSNSLSSTGQTSQFQLNKQTGNLKILTEIVPGDTISAGTADDKGFVVSATTTGTYNVSNDTNGRPSEVVVVLDSSFCNAISVPTSVGVTLNITDQGSSVMRITSSTASMWSNVQPGHFIYLASRSASWLSTSNTGLFKVIARGDHLIAGTDTYIEVLNNTISVESVSVIDPLDVKAFSTDGYPQIWRGALTPSPATASLTDIVDSFNDNILGISASVFRSNSVKLTSITETGGSIAVPVSIGNASVIFAETASSQFGNPPHIANVVSDKDLMGLFRRTQSVSTNVWLDRETYSSITGSLTSTSNPDAFPYSSTYSEQVTSTGVLTSANVGYSDVLAFTDGNNRNLLKSIKAQTGTNTVGTQQGTLRTEFDHVVGDKVTLIDSLKLAADDNIVFVLDKDASNKTIDINMARTARVNSGSNALSFTPTTTEFSADDTDNEPGVDFSNLVIWGTAANDTDFSDYVLMMRARNWYSTGGVSGVGGKMIVRSTEYGANGNNMQFAIMHPSNPDQENSTVLTNFPSYGRLTYYFGSGSDKTTAISAGTTITITGPYPDSSTNFPGGVASSGNYYDYDFSAGSFGTVIVGDVLSILTTSGVSTTSAGQFRIAAISGNTLRVFNPSASAGSETISTPSGVHIFPLVNTAVSDIVAKINESNILVAAAVGSSSLQISKSTIEDDYAYGGDSTALGYGHDPGTSSLRDHISLYDGINWIKSFSNSNPNFTLKTTLTLNGVAPSVYAMNTAPNEDSTTGEYIKLVPSTVKNLRHHFSQKALSQLPIVANIDIAKSGKNIQIRSKQLGSVGAIEVVGGQANKAQTAVLGEPEVATDITGSYLEAKISAFPNSFSVGDVVEIFNQAGVKRLSRLSSTDTMNIVSATNYAQYEYGSKATNFVSGTTFTIADISATYGRPAGTVWRWTHGGGGATLADVAAGDLVAATGTLSGWSQGNKARSSGEGKIAGLPIIAVNDGANWFDVVNPYGEAMSSTSIGVSGSVKIFPTPAIRWNLKHSSLVDVDNMSRTSGTVTVNCTTEHLLKTGDSFALYDSNNIVDGSYTVVSVSSSTSFTFTLAGTDFTESNSPAKLIKSSASRTKYKLQKMGINGLTKISRSSGDSPSFTDSGVAVDDYLVISGSTFSSSNHGVFRVLAVDNDSIIMINNNAIDNINTIETFNNKSLLATWTRNSAVVTGVAGTFKYVLAGDWVKKEEDEDSAYRQVISISGSPSTATQITLGDVYNGASGTSMGVSYNQDTDYNAGVFLQNANDIVVYEGDAALEGDKLTVQNIVDPNWFSINNTGTFDIIKIGSNSDGTPYVRVQNASSTTESGILMSVEPEGLYIVESESNKISSYRVIHNALIDNADSTKRALYLSPSSRQYKFSQANNTYISHVGKIGYEVSSVIGVDGYLYYTGLLRKVQRIVDGFEPDAQNYPGRRAVGGLIEILPPLIKNIYVTVTVKTNEGVNVGDVSDNIKSAIIDYVDGLGVGADVIISEIIAKIMQVKGIEAVTFNYPTPDTERVTVAKNEKATILPENIKIG